MARDPALEAFASESEGRAAVMIGPERFLDRVLRVLYWKTFSCKKFDVSFRLPDNLASSFLTGLELDACEDIVIDAWVVVGVRIGHVVASVQVSMDWSSLSAATSGHNYEEAFAGCPLPAIGAEVLYLDVSFAWLCAVPCGVVCAPGRAGLVGVIGGVAVCACIPALT